MDWLLAQAAPPAGPGTPAPFWLELLKLWPFLAIGVIFWLLLIRPERQKQKKRQKLLEEIVKNDHIVTIGGLHGVVKSISDTEVTLMVDEKHDVAMKFNRSAIFAKVTGNEEKGELEPPQK